MRFCTALLVASLTLSSSICSASAIDEEINIPEIQAAAEKGDPEAQFQLGSAYQQGDGVTQNDLQAIHWMNKSANQGYPDAQFNLGMAYRGGYGVQQDVITAYMWLELAVANGSVKAFDLRRDVASSMNLKQIEEAKYRAAHWKPAKED